MNREANEWVEAEWLCYCSHTLTKQLETIQSNQLIMRAWCNNCSKSYKVTIEEND